MTRPLLSRRTLALLLAAGFAAGPALAQADRFPSRPIKVLIGFTAGGSTDVPFRVLAENASKILGQPVIIENKPGAGGVLPAQMMQNTPADGYTLAQIPLPVFRLPYTQKINWDPATDLQYVIGLAGYAVTFCIGIFVFKPMAGRMVDMITRDGVTPAALAQGQFMLRAARIDYSVMLVILAAMVMKPTLGDIGVLAAMALVLATGITLAIGVRRRLAPTPA